MTEHYYGLHCKITKIRGYQYRSGIQQYISSYGQTYQIRTSDILQREIHCKTDGLRRPGQSNKIPRYLREYHIGQR